MIDDECPHGLDASWCSLCKATREGRPAGSRGSGTRVGGGRPTIADRPDPSRLVRARPRPATSLTPPFRSSASRTPAPPPTPAAALAKLRPVLFHATAHGSWESIRASGLRTAAKLRADAGLTPPTGLRATGVDLVVEDAPARLRDQRLQIRSRIEAHLDDLSLSGWLGILDERIHLFARQRDLTAMLTRYSGEGQDLVVLDTAAVLAAAGDRVEVATVASGAPEAWGSCRCRSRDTFIPLPLFEDPVADIEEVTVVGGLEDPSGLVNRVVRYHPDRTSEVIWSRS